MSHLALRLSIASILLLPACSDPRQKAMDKIKDDSEAIGKANLAASEVLRNATDCDVARPLLAEAYQRIEETRKIVTMPASQATLDSLKAQVDRVDRSCQ
jgi:hypothetical protein